MPGLPTELLLAIMAISFFLAIYTLSVPPKSKSVKNRTSSLRINLLAFPLFEKFAKNRKFQFILQLLPVVLLLLIIATGLFGLQSSHNFAPVLTWTIWWSLLIFDIVLLGRSWCLICPWYAIATWLRRASFWRRTSEPFSLNLSWPKSLKNLYLAIGLFLILTWLELGFSVTSNPQMTAILAILMSGLVIVPALIYDKMSFCRYGCLIGRICGLYSLVAPVEIRAKDKNVCSACQGRECRHGSNNGYPCPTDLDLGALQKNTYCINCTECIKSCPYDNVAYNIRPVAADLNISLTPRKDESVLAVVLLAMTSFHGLTMTPLWDRFLTILGDVTGLPHLALFTFGMALVLLFFLTTFAATGLFISRYESNRGGHYTDTKPAEHFAYALIPLALFYHLAHNGAHFIKEAGALLVAISDPFGWGWNLFGHARQTVSPILPSNFTWGLQSTLIIVGFMLSLKICRSIILSRYPDIQQRIVPASIMIISLFLFHCCNLWLLYQPMTMRSGL